MQRPRRRHRPEHTADRIELLRELLAAPWKLSAALLLALAATAASLSLPLLVEDVIAGFAGHASLRVPVLWMCAVAVMGAAATTGAGFLVADAGERMVFRVRGRVMAHVLRLPLPTVRAQGIGSLTARITSDALQLRQVVDVGTQLPVAALTVVTTSVVMLLIDWVLTLVTVAGLAVATAVITGAFRRLRRSITDQQAAIGTIAQRFAAHLDALTALKAGRAESLAVRALTADADALRRTSLTGARLQAALPAATTLGNQSAMIAVILAGGARIASGHLGVAEFAAFLLYLLQTIPSATTLTNGLGRLQAGLAARDRCNQLLALADEAAQAPTGRAPHPVPGAPAVAFDAVTFTHPGTDTPALRKLSFTAPCVGLTALVGHSGAGKTTALCLVEGFLRPTGGRIEILGHDLDTWPLDGLRRHIAYVDQKFTLVEATVRENLQLGRDTPGTDDELSHVLTALDLDDVVAALPQGLDTVLGRGTDLSGGQRQRLALARALLSDAEVILLDEPTSQLDGLNEQRLRTVVDALAADRAVIVVAHRLTTVRHAHQVVMVEAGTVVGTGDHRTLLRTCPAYRRLVNAQTLHTPTPREPTLGHPALPT
ncbi:ABC transporter [Streptomyces fumigatiscleroticus]|nr:ABC transporter [Streptomyces fumigatiscleroticus]